MPNLRIFYITNARMPTEKAHGYQIAKMCEAFADSGAEVTLGVPERTNSITDTVFRYYGVKQNFQIHFLPVIDWLALPMMAGPPGFFLLRLHFMIKSFFMVIPPEGVIYTRSPEIAWLFSKRGYRTFFECHQMPDKKSWLFGKCIRRVTGIVAITAGLRKDILQRYGYPEKDILVAPDGVDLEVFDIKTLREAARQALGLPQDKRIVLYTGHLFVWKGVDTLAEAAQALPADVLVYMVGGTTDEIAFFRKRNADSSRVNNVPARPRKEIAMWLKAADVLVLPNSGKQAISEKYTSPLKLFEYMASGTPIVASDLPSLTEILDKDLATLFRADDRQALSACIEAVLRDAVGSRLKATTAYGQAGRYTWLARARNISEFLRGKSDYARWDDVQNLLPEWDSRTRMIAGMIPRGSKVIEFGAGRLVLRDLLPKGSTYTPSDLVDRGPGTLVCDLNSDRLPSFEAYDTAVFSGVLEYVNDVPGLIDRLSNHASDIIASYAVTDNNMHRRHTAVTENNGHGRHAKGWVNAYSTKQFIDLFGRYGYRCLIRKPWDKQVIFHFVKKTFPDADQT